MLDKLKPRGRMIGCRIYLVSQDTVFTDQSMAYINYEQIAGLEQLTPHAWELYHPLGWCYELGTTGEVLASSMSPGHSTAFHLVPPGHSSAVTYSIQSILWLIHESSLYYP